MNDVNLDEWTSWLVFYEKVDETKTIVYHIMGYKDIPEQIDIAQAITEVKNDPEFGLGDKIYELQYAILEKDEGRELAQYLLDDD